MAGLQVWLTCTTWGWPEGLNGGRGLDGGNGSYMFGSGQWHKDMVYSDPVVGSRQQFMAQYEQR